MKRLGFLVFLLTGSLFANQNIPDEVISQMIQIALAGQKNAYAPYSNYFVGSALLGKSGKIYSGCNVENAAYGVGNCSERTAVFKAVSEGEKEFDAVVVATKDGGTPCGACRQVLNEFNPHMTVISVDQNGQIKGTYTLDQLLPYAFGPANLEE